MNEAALETLNTFYQTETVELSELKHIFTFSQYKLKCLKMQDGFYIYKPWVPIFLFDSISLKIISEIMGLQTDTSFQFGIQNVSVWK